MRLGKAPDDGDCFFHSLIQVAGPTLAEKIQVPREALTPKHVRDHMASHLIDQFLALNKPDADLEKWVGAQPYLIELMSTSDARPMKLVDTSTRTGMNDFVAVLGAENARKCKSLRADQKTHVYNIAKSRSWNTSTSDIVALLAPAAFKGMKLTAMTAATTADNADMYTQGEGQAYHLFLDTERTHYVPAFAQ